MVIIESGYMCQEPLYYSIYFNVIFKFSTIKCQKINKLKNDMQGILELNGSGAKILAFQMRKLRPREVKGLVQCHKAQQ